MKNSLSIFFSIKHLYKGAALYGAADIFVALIRFGLIAVYTRCFTPAEFGLYAVIQTTITLLVLIIPSGLASAIIINFRENRPDKIKSNKDAAFFALLVNSFIAVVIMSLLTVAFHPAQTMSHLFPWLVIWTGTKVLGSIPAVSLRFREKITEYGAAKVIGVTVMTLCLIYLTVFLKMGIKGVIISEAIGSFFELIFNMFFDKYKPSLPNYSLLPGLFKMGLPLCAISLGVFLIDLSDRYVLYLMIGKHALGYYAAAARIALAAMFITEAFNSMWTPYYYRIAGKETELADSYYKAAQKLVLIFGLVISLTMILLPVLVEVKLFGKYIVSPAYHPVKVLIAPLVLISFFKMLFYLSTPVITFTRKNWKLSAYIFFAAGINIVGNILIINNTSTTNSLTALYMVSLITSFSYMICSGLALRDTLRILKHENKIIIYITASAFFVLAVLIIPNNVKFLFWIVVSVLFYVRIRFARQ